MNSDIGLKDINECVFTIRVRFKVHDNPCYGLS